MKVIVDVSVATMEALMAHHGTPRPARKYWLVVCCFRPNHAPAAPFTAPDQVFPDFITRHLPTGLSGLVVAAIFAAAMSSSLNSIAAAFVADLYKPLAYPGSLYGA